MKIYLVRHGRTDWNVEGRIMGDKDIPLNNAGKKEAELAGNYLKDKKIQKIITSPVKRCIQTAMIIADITKAHTQHEERLKEVDFGEWVEKVYKDLKKEGNFKSYYQYFDERVIPGGEKFNEAKKRVIDAFEDLKTENGSNIAIVTHADPIKIIVSYILGSPLSNSARVTIDSGSISCILLKKYPVLEFMNMTLAGRQKVIF